VQTSWQHVDDQWSLYGTASVGEHIVGAIDGGGCSLMGKASHACQLTQGMVCGATPCLCDSGVRSASSWRC
jgi:hypothetical protein